MMTRYSNGPEAFPAPPGRLTVPEYAAQRSGQPSMRYFYDTQTER
jgi:hypothetical protein